MGLLFLLSGVSLGGICTLVGLPTIFISYKKQGAEEGKNQLKNRIGELIDSLENKESQVDLTFERVGLRLMHTPVKIELNGTISIKAKTRELSGEEKKLVHIPEERKVVTLAPAQETRRRRKTVSLLD